MSNVGKYAVFTDRWQDYNADKYVPRLIERDTAHFYWLARPGASAGWMSSRYEKQCVAAIFDTLEEAAAHAAAASAIWLAGEAKIRAAEKHLIHLKDARVKASRAAARGEPDEVAPEAI